MSAPVVVREYQTEDEPAVLELLAASLGWRADEPQKEFFQWKHHQNPFGASPGWVALVDGRIAGFRTFMRWEFERAGRVVRAARAVDTATHPDHQGRGIFRLLTLHALEALRADGVAFVFNTPNDNSRPGYLKMGWVPVGTLPVAVRVRNPASAGRMAFARVPAERWSKACSVGLPAGEVLRLPGMDTLLSVTTESAGLRTRRTREFLSWRYDFPALGYRALLIGRSVDEGVVLFRLRRRGPAVEAALVDLLVPAGLRAARLARRVLRETGADYGLALGPAPGGMLGLPRVGPLLVWRALTDVEPPPLDSWRLTLGDVELF